jgi:hypothetical protein
MTKLYHKDATGCSWNGETFERQEDGSFEVPNEAAADLAIHGFTATAPVVATVQTVTETVALSGNPAKWTKDQLAAEALRLGIDATQDRSTLLKLVAAARKAEADAALDEAEKE